ncbi:uncharacterized protein [Nicotiana tomentosiformis]|uniref:uncharacterized protein n=1 Tax=Nicotiana tomentosiformis TaxID=4098 RepID=UPI00388C583B
MQESSYRPPTIQGSSSGYSGPQGQTSSKQPIAPKGCYECRDLSHMWRFYLRLQGRPVKQGQQPMITALVTPLAVRPPRARGHVGRGHPRGGGQPVGTLARFYAFPARPDAEASDAMITGIISGASQESLSTPVYVSTPVSDSVVVNQIYRSCVVTLYGYETRADLLLLDMTGFEIILGMDWLSPYHVVLNSHAKTITLAIPEFPRLKWKGLSVSSI